MRICFISLMEGYRWGGSEELWVATARLALKEGHDVMISIKKWNSVHEKIVVLKDLGAKLVERDQSSIRFGKRLINAIGRKVGVRTEDRTWNHISEFNPNKVCISSGHLYDTLYTQGFSSWMINSGISYSIIIQFNSENNPVPAVYWTHAREFFRNAAGLFFVAKRNKEVAERNLAQELLNAFVIANPCKLFIKEALPFPVGSGLKMACVARLEAIVKSQDILISILAGNNWSGRDWILNIYGEGPDEEYLLALISLYGLQDKIKLCGQTLDVVKIWEQHQVMLLPSLAEGTPLSIIEAMHCGRAAVANDVGGNAELITHGVNGFIASGVGKAAFAAVMEELWNKRNNLSVMGLNAHESIREFVAKDSSKEILEHLTLI